MATEMTAGEVETHLSKSQKLDEYEYRDEDDENDYVVAALYQATDGRKFRYVDSSDFDSDFSGAGNFGEWLEPHEVETWKDFYP